jgi:hypothetical protein
MSTINEQIEVLELALIKLRQFQHDELDLRNTWPPSDEISSGNVTEETLQRHSTLKKRSI